MISDKCHVIIVHNNGMLASVKKYYLCWEEVKSG